MGRLTVQGLEDFSSRIAALGSKGVPMIKMAIYDGAAIMIEQVKREIQGIPEEEGYMPPGRKRHVIAARDKKALLDHAGISHMQDREGKVSLSISFDGYTDYTTRSFPQGVPIPLLARSIVKGTSVRSQYDFMQRAKRAAQQAAQNQMIVTASNYIQQIQK